MAKKLHIMTVISESGDHYGPFIFEKKPDDKALLKFLRKHTSDDDVGCGEGPGWMGTHLQVEWTSGKVH